MLLNLNCVNFLSGGIASIDPAAILRHIQSSGEIIVTSIAEKAANTQTSATTEISGYTTVEIGPQSYQQQASSVLIKINDPKGDFVTGDTGSESDTVLHELGHAIYDLYGPAGKGILLPKLEWVVLQFKTVIRPDGKEDSA